VTNPDAPQDMSLGGRVAGRIAQVVIQASLQAKQQAGGHTAGIAQTVLRDFTNHVSDEIRGAMGPVWTQFAQHPETPDSLRPTFQALATETGQAWGFIGGLVTSTTLGGGLLDVIINELAPATHSAIASNPHGLLSIADAAQALATGRNHNVDLGFDMRAQGLDANRQQVAVNLAEASLTPDVILELLRRKVINDADARSLLGRLGYRETDIDRTMTLREMPLSPGDAAAAWARNSLSQAQTDAIGAKAGVSAADMAVLRDLAGQPPSPEELLFAWRRGVITDKDVDRGIIQGPIRNEWIPVVKALQWIPLPISEAANAVNQGHMTLAEGQKVARENGFTNDVFSIIVDNAGIPPGPQEALDWVNRGLITEADFRSIFLESRIKNKYIDLYLKSRYAVMPAETVRLMVSRGAMSKEDGLHRLMALGYTAADAAIIMDGASAEKTTKGRDLTVSQVLALRADGLITDDDTLAMLQAAGYDADEALWITQLADLQRVSTFVRAAIARTKASYVAGRLSEVDAGGVLDRLGLPGDFKDQAFALWDLERTTVTKGLTPAQIVSAVKKGFLSPNDGVSRLTGQGYDPQDAAILLALGGAVTTGSAPREGT
jgi:hypothetical protein